MAKSNHTNDALSAVTVYFKDHFGQPIQNLKVEIKGMEERLDHVYHTASTNAQGAVEFSVRMGEALSVHVKRWTSDSMKEVARLDAALSQIKFHLTSPKTLHDLPTKTDDGAGGDYWRGTYKVKAHDNLTVIARKYHTSVDLLKHVNHLKSDLIVVGQVLKVPPVDSRKSDAPAPKKPDPKGAPPKNDHDNNDRGAPTTTPRKGGAPIIFPIQTRPLNDEGGKYGDCPWVKPLGAGGLNLARFGTPREQGRRKHAARDLYVDAYTPIVAIAPGVVMKREPFYCKTWQLSIHHKTTDGREFIALYGEVDPSSIKVKVGESVSQGQLIAKSGVLLHDDGTPLTIVHGKNVSMLHFETYSGALGFDPNSKLNGKVLKNAFQRREDLMDSVDILQEGYRAVFLDAPPLPPVGNRIPIAQLKLSERGKDFIKGWEGVHLDKTKENTYYYDDSKGYCTVGWGHLIQEASCSASGYIAMSSKIPVADAKKLFDDDVAVIEGRVRNAITVPLYQHEYDALVSLAFNLGSLSKTPNLRAKLNKCDYAGAPKEFLDIENEKRRKREYDMFCQGVYNSAH
ncbi:LysM peptidoglycan-binding domain-containing protein [Burkholderia multivorans]|uniref:Lysozyme n=1 Tax=Burkholderia ubonensis TaxID=101571 RepID=A0A103RU68_9BURK|nr:LysM peptidoglycan-binding domain-containing protein [Burkholderia ubonensis]AYZ67617.1 LysM peptidoglycan-binding domain-containing protein [Burkholderia multivorans]AOJ61897.1 peptidoglycan-binding protein [Burkholderia ubonensis]KUZ67284.1 peptidoglycan-binding protein [Burkholderia ubonensis]KVG74024.1 peptidoglycan-binding protein [Burkholderia ubonensis]VWC19310.1 peptidoglycan-binding LysM [Burkholderia ubonensis]